MKHRDIVQSYLDKNYSIVTWPQFKDTKGPRESQWTTKQYTLADYKSGYRVGILTGTEVQPGRFLHDVDIDWSPGSLIAQRLLLPSDFIFGRASKRVSHCFYTTTEALPSIRFEDIDKSCLIELRGTKANGEVGMQTMVPPSTWTKDGAIEPLIFVKSGDPGHVEEPSTLKQSTCLAAIGMLLAKHLDQNGFGHEPRLAWAGFLLRAGIAVEDLVVMGEGISAFCNNTEISDVRRVVESTAARLKDQKVRGGPALAKLIGDKGKSVIERINDWLGRNSDFIRNQDGVIIKDSQENIKRAVALCECELSRQAFSERTQIRESSNQPGGAEVRALEDAQAIGLWLRIDREYHFRPSYAFYEKVISDIAYSNSYHPVEDYLNSLTWDGRPRIDTWISKYGGGPDSAYHRAVSSIVLIAAVKRIRSPGCKYDEMLILESKQGLNKSSALRALCVNEEWFSDDLPLNVDAKQIIERTLGKWLIEASDLAGKRKAEIDQLKSMLSRQVDGPARMAYAHYPVERSRQFLIVGTTNATVYLSDPTGARRFWPVKVKGFNIPALAKDRDQLWAEAVKREADGESIRLPERLWKMAEEHQENRREIDAWEEILSDVVDQVAPGPSGRRRVTSSRLWDVVQPDLARRDTLGGRRISEIMQRLGFERTRLNEGGKTVIGYISDQEKLDYGEDV